MKAYKQLPNQLLSSKIRTAVLASLALISPATGIRAEPLSSPQETPAAHQHRHVEAHGPHHPKGKQWIPALENPERDQWQKPEQVVAALKIQSGEVIADIGAGSGYFTRRFARHAAKVFAVEIDPELVTYLREHRPGNVVVIQADPDDPKLPPASVDTVFICNVLHHIENRPAYYQKLKQALKPGGRIVIIDFYRKPLPVGPPPSMKLAKEEVISELTAAGFQLIQSLDFLPYQYFLIFRVHP